MLSLSLSKVMPPEKSKGLVLGVEGPYSALN